jgi:hypothetical protein
MSVNTDSNLPGQANLNQFITNAVESMEVGSTNPFAPSFAGPNSALAFGQMQDDVGHQKVLPQTNMSAADVLAKSLTDYAANNTTTLTPTTIAQIVAMAGKKGITAAQLNAAFPNVQAAPGGIGPAKPIVPVIQEALTADAALVQQQDQAAAQFVIGETETFIHKAQSFAGGPGVLDEKNLDPAAVAMIAAWINQTGIPKAMTKALSQLSGPITDANIQNYLSLQKYFKTGGGNLSSWESRINTAVNHAFSQQPGSTALSDAPPMVPPIPAADADGDISSLGDLVNGGTQDPNEGSEGDEEIVNIGGQGVDLRADTTLHSSTLNLNPTSFIPQIMLDNIIGALGLSVTSANISIPLSAYAGLSADLDMYAQTSAGLSASTYELMIAAQDDPYDPNFKQVYTPITPTTVSLPALPSNIPAAAAITLQNDLTASLAAMGRVVSDANATYVTQNRLFSAYNAGDVASFVLQNSALNGFIATLAKDEGTISTADAAVATDLSTLGITVNVTLANVTSFQGIIDTQGFDALPALEQTIIETFLPTQAEQATVATLMSSDETAASLVPLSLTSALRTQASTASSIAHTLTIPPPTNLTVPPLPSRTITGTGPHAIATFSGPESRYTIKYVGNETATVTDSVGNVVTSINNEMLQFSDQPYFIVSGDGSNIARLYSAGLGRIADPKGLFGWEDLYAKNVSSGAKAQGVYISLAETSGGFNGDLSISDGVIKSPEFNSKYGSLSNSNFVTQLYNNVLGRSPEPTGLNGWLKLMSGGVSSDNPSGQPFTQAMVLVGFAESPENIARTSSWLTDMSRSG